MEAIARVLPFVAGALRPNHEKLMSELLKDVSLDATVVERVWDNLPDEDKEWLGKLAEEVAGLIYAVQEGVKE